MICCCLAHAKLLKDEGQLSSQADTEATNLAQIPRFNHTNKDLHKKAIP